MHIPDGFLSKPVWIGMDVVSAGTLTLAVRHVNRTLEPERVPLMGMTGAFLFAAQMINFPVAGGTSGHLLGGFLAALLLGAAPAIIVMTCVFAVQCLLFQDGGITALGANLFNMGILGAVGGYALFRLLLVARVPLNAAISIGAWSSVMLGALAASIELGASGVIPYHIVLPAMLGVHALIGIGEALITLAAVRLILKARPELLAGRIGTPKLVTAEGVLE